MDINNDFLFITRRLSPHEISGKIYIVFLGTSEEISGGGRGGGGASQRRNRIEKGMKRMEREQYPVKSLEARGWPLGKWNTCKVSHLSEKFIVTKIHEDEKSFLECELSLEHHGGECVIEGIVEHFSHANTLPNADP